MPVALGMFTPFFCHWYVPFAFGSVTVNVMVSPSHTGGTGSVPTTGGKLQVDKSIPISCPPKTGSFISRQLVCSLLYSFTNGESKYSPEFSPLPKISPCMKRSVPQFSFKTISSQPLTFTLYVSLANT